MDKAQKSSNPECYTPLSESFITDFNFFVYHLHIYTVTDIIFKN
jgi:hypothetical protein